MSANRSSSILAVDFGNVHTRAILIDLVDGIYYLVAQGEVQTTAGFPNGDVAIGLARVVEQISRATGRRMMTDDLRQVITPEQPDRSGVDTLIFTASIGRPLRTVLMGLVPSISVASGRRSAAGTYIEIVDTFSLDDPRPEQDRFNALIAARPDLIFIVGGSEGGAEQPVLELAQMARLSLQTARTSSKPIVLFAGNSALIAPMRTLFDGLTTLFVAENVRPTLERESLEAAQLQLALSFDSYTERRGLGFDVIGAMSRLGILPTAQSYELIVGYLGRAQPGGVLAVDTGSAVSTLSASIGGTVSTSIRTDIGLGHSAAALLDAVGMDAVRAWLPFEADESEIRAYALNKTLRPATVPETLRGLYLEHALTRAALGGLLKLSRPTWTPEAVDEVNEPLPPFSTIIGAGAALTRTGRPGMAALLLLDAFQPTGVTTLQADANALIPALGALARVNPEAVVQVLDANGLETLCTAVSLSGAINPGKAAAVVRITTEKGETQTHTVQGGTLWAYPLSLGVRAQVQVNVIGRALTIGGKKRVRFDIEGGTAGLIVDARGRPLPLGATVHERAAQLPLWYAQATGDPVRESPAAWDASAPAAPEPEPAADSTRRERHARKRPTEESVSLAEINAAKQSRPKRGLFGRGRKTQPLRPAEPVMPEAQAQGDDLDDLRRLLP